MKTSIYTLLFFLILSNTSRTQIEYKESTHGEKCWQDLIAKIPAYDSLLKLEIIHFRELVEYSLTVRAGMSKVAEEMNTKENVPLPSSTINYLRSKTEKALKLRNDLYEVTNKYRCALELSKREKEKYNVPDALRTKSVFLSLAAALTLYDNYLLGELLLEQNPNLRKFLNETDQGFGISKNQLLEITLAANSIENQKTIQIGIQFFEDKIKLQTNLNDEDFTYLIDVITSSPSYNYLKNIDPSVFSQEKFKMITAITSDYLAKIASNSSNSVSKFFGNSIGIVQTRKGKLYKNNEVLEDVKAKIQPLDILLEKTPFRLTDKFIPGHFGHVAIWVGNKQELIQKDIWNNEFVKPHQQVICKDTIYPTSKDNKQVVEALRSGVQLSSLEDFLNVDDVLILRPVSIQSSSELSKESLLLAFRQLGKEYDFNFNVNTTEKIVCSELAYVCFPSIDWNTEKVAGRFTISPDNVAGLALMDKTFEVVLFYHNGIKVEDAQIMELLKKLISKK
jgi:uncharacterized protein YycO